MKEALEICIFITILFIILGEAFSGDDDC